MKLLCFLFQLVECLSSITGDNLSCPISLCDFVKMAAKMIMMNSNSARFPANFHRGLFLANRLPALGVYMIKFHYHCFRLHYQYIVLAHETETEIMFRLRVVYTRVNWIMNERDVKRVLGGHARITFSRERMTQREKAGGNYIFRNPPRGLLARWREPGGAMHSCFLFVLDIFGGYLLNQKLFAFVLLQRRFPTSQRFHHVHCLDLTGVKIGHLDESFTGTAEQLWDWGDMTEYWGGRGAQYIFFLLTLYNFKNIGGHVPPLPPPPPYSVVPVFG